MNRRIFRRTKIIFTVGPATESPEMLDRILDAGADVCRINMAHATHEWTRKVVKNIREASERTGRDIAIMMDVKGPEIRTGLVDTPIRLQAGELFDFTIERPQGSGAGEGRLPVGR